jgi:hypothetical protein
VTVTAAEFSQQNLDVYYTLRYQYIHCAVGGNLNLTAAYSGLITNAALIFKALCSDATLTGAVNNITPTIGPIGQVADGAGNRYWGCDFTIRIMQFLEV